MRMNLSAIGISAAVLLALSGCGGVVALSKNANAPGKPKPKGPVAPAPPVFKAFKPNPEEVVAVLPDAVGPLAFALDGRTLVACKKGSAPALVLWDVQGTEPKLLAEVPAHAKLIWALAFSPDGQTLASCSLDETVCLWDFTDGQVKLRCKLDWHKGPIDAIAWSRDGKTLACSGGNDKRGGENWHVTLWDVSAAAGREIRTFNGGTAVALAPDGKTLATAWAVDIYLWDLSEAEPLHQATLQGHTGSINSLAFSPDGKTLVSVSKDRSVRLWDVAGEDEREVCDDHRGPVAFVAWAANGKMFATAGESDPGRVILRDPTGKKLKEWTVPQNDLYGCSIAFSPDSRRLAFPVLGESSTRLVYILRVD